GQSRLSFATGIDSAGRHHRRRLWSHHPPVDDRPSSPRQHQCPRLLASQVSRCRSHSMGHRQRRARNRRNHYANRRRTRYRRHAPESRTPHFIRRHLDHALAASLRVGSPPARRNPSAPRGRQTRSHATRPLASLSRSDLEKRRRPDRLHSLRLRHSQPPTRLSTLALSLHDFPRQTVRNPCCPARRSIEPGSGRTRRHRRFPPGRLRKPHRPGTSRSSTGRKEAHGCTRLRQRISSASRRTAGGLTCPPHPPEPQHFKSCFAFTSRTPTPRNSSTPISSHHSAPPTVVCAPSLFLGFSAGSHRSIWRSLPSPTKLRAAWMS